MHILFHLGHPAHYHLFKNSIKKLKVNHKISILIKKKDILEDLLKEDDIEFINILPKGRNDSKIGLLIGLIKIDFKILIFTLKEKPNILVGTSPNISHIGRLLNIPSIIVNEDDAHVVPYFAKLSYPFCKELLSPVSCNNGKWDKKSIKYNSYHELAYLHPNNFKPSKENIKSYIDFSKPYFILRFAKLTAHHDKGIKGLTDEIVIKIINILKQYGNIYITSEKKLGPTFEKYRLTAKITDIHNILYFAKLYIGDSQTMAAESGVLGIPFIRFNDFVGKIGYLNELENKYQLGFGIKTNEVNKLLNTINQLVNTENLNKIYQTRRKKMLYDKIDYAAFLTWFIEKYPISSKIIKENPNFQYRF